MTKQELRERILQARARIPSESRARLDKLIRSHLTRSTVWESADAVLLYAPIQGEIDLLPLVSLCHQQGKTVAFPICDRDTDRMEFRVLSPDTPLTPGRFGIPEPPHDAPLCPMTERTLCVLPGLSFDREGNRLGYGKGYYDYFLSDFPGKTVGAVYEKLMTPSLPKESHDLPVDLLITENGLIDATANRPKEQTPPKKPRGERIWSAIQGFFSPVVHLFSQRKDEAATPLQDEAVAALPEPRHAPVVLTLVILSLLLILRLLDPLMAGSTNTYFLTPLFQLLVFGLPLGIYLRWHGGLGVKRLRLRPVRPEHIWFCVCLLIVMILGSLLLSILTGGIDALSGNFTLYNTFVARTDGSVWKTLLVIVTYALLPALCEEPIFRGVMIAEYESAGVGASVFISALFFAFLHASFPLFLNYLFLGLLLSLSLYATRSLLAPVLLHLLYNLFCLFGQPYLSAFYVRSGSNEIFLFCLIALFLLFAAFLSGEARKIYHLYAKANLTSDHAPIVPLWQYPRRILRVLFSPATAVLLVLWLTAAILDLVL